MAIAHNEAINTLIVDTLTATAFQSTASEEGVFDRADEVDCSRCVSEQIPMHRNGHPTRKASVMVLWSSGRRMISNTGIVTIGKDATSHNSRIPRLISAREAKTF